MKCPCDGTELARVELAGIQLDKCHKCDGIWCDPGEMEQLRDAHLTSAEEVLKEKYGDPSIQEGRTDGYMQCPRCEGGRLQRCHYTYVKPVKIDRCEMCLGVWLDRGELDAIAGEKKALDEASAEPAKLRAFLRSLGGMLGGK